MNHFAVPRSCPGQHFLQAVLSSFCNGCGGEGQRPFTRWIPTVCIPPQPHGALTAMVAERCSPTGLLPSSLHPSHLSTQNCAPASVGWEEGSSVGWPHWSWELMPETPRAHPAGLMQNPGFRWIKPQGLPGMSVLHVTSHHCTVLLIAALYPITAPCDFQATSKLTNSSLYCCQVVPKHSPSLCSARHHDSI